MTAAMSMATSAKTTRGAPRQVDLAWLKIVEERSDRGEQRPEDQDVGREPVRDRVDHTQGESQMKSIWAPSVSSMKSLAEMIASTPS